MAAIHYCGVIDRMDIAWIILTMVVVGIATYFVWLHLDSEMDYHEKLVRDCQRDVNDTYGLDLPLDDKLLIDCAYGRQMLSTIQNVEDNTAW